MAETYTIEIAVSTNKVGSETKDVTPLAEYGYSDEEWDELTAQDQDDLISGWVEEFAWQNTNSWGVVHRG